MFTKEEYETLVDCVLDTLRELNIGIEEEMYHISDEEDKKHLKKLIKQNELLHSVWSKLDNYESVLIEVD